MLARSAVAAELQDRIVRREERARRERLREGAGGITAYATDAATTVFACALAARLVVGVLLSWAARELDVVGPVFDPRPDPPARRIAYVISGGNVRTNSFIDEAVILNLEREAFVDFWKEEKTVARVEHMLTTGKPLRN